MFYSLYLPYSFNCICKPYTFAHYRSVFDFENCLLSFFNLNFIYLQSSLFSSPWNQSVRIRWWYTIREWRAIAMLRFEGGFACDYPMVFPRKRRIPCDGRQYDESRQSVEYFEHHFFHLRTLGGIHMRCHQCCRQTEILGLAYCAWYNANSTIHIFLWIITMGIGFQYEVFNSRVVRLLVIVSLRFLKIPFNNLALFHYGI